jgi:hypothetical protein
MNHFWILARPAGADLPSAHGRRNVARLGEQETAPNGRVVGTSLQWPRYREVGVQSMAGQLAVLATRSPVADGTLGDKNDGSENLRIEGLRSSRDRVARLV